MGPDEAGQAHGRDAKRRIIGSTQEFALNLGIACLGQILRHQQHIFEVVSIALQAGAAAYMS